jgi:hypothetical protein
LQANVLYRIKYRVLANNGTGHLVLSTWPNGLVNVIYQTSLNVSVGSHEIVMQFPTVYTVPETVISINAGAANTDVTIDNFIVQ